MIILLSNKVKINVLLENECCQLSSLVPNTPSLNIEHFSSVCCVPIRQGDSIKGRVKFVLIGKLLPRMISLSNVYHTQSL